MQQRGANFEDANGSRLISSFKGVISCTLKIYRYSINTPYLDQLIYLGVRGYQDSSKVLCPASLESFPMRQSLLLCTRNVSRHCARLNNQICVQNTNFTAIFPMTLISRETVLKNRKNIYSTNPGSEGIIWLIVQLPIKTYSAYDNPL